MDDNQRREVLDSKVHPEGKGEDPAVEAYLDPEFEKKPVQERIDIALQLQQVLAGQGAIIEKIAQGDVQAAHLQDELNLLRARLEERERAAESYEANQQKFRDRLFDDMDELRSVDPEVIAKAQAQATKDLQEQVTNKKARRAVSEMSLKEKLRTEPQETITPTGELVLTRISGNLQPKLIDESITIGPFRYQLPVGIPIKVPRSVAQQYRQRKAALKENDEIAELLSAEPGKVKKDTDIAREWSKFSGEPFLIASRV